MHACSAFWHCIINTIVISNVFTISLALQMLWPTMLAGRLLHLSDNALLTHFSTSPSLQPASLTL